VEILEENNFLIQLMFSEEDVNFVEEIIEKIKAKQNGTN
jgi:hypothetical protein